MIMQNILTPCHIYFTVLKSKQNIGYSTIQKSNYPSRSTSKFHLIQTTGIILFLHSPKIDIFSFEKKRLDASCNPNKWETEKKIAIL